MTVTVSEGSIDPNTVELRVPDRTEVTVKSRSDQPCKFHLGPYVRGLHVEPDDEASSHFTVFDFGEDSTVMGCEGGGIPDGTAQILDATER